MKTRSILPNSSPEILRPMPFHGATLQVVWDDDADTHRLMFGDAELTAHHNGHSCHALAKRLIAGDVARIMGQAQYNIDCGGSSDLAAISKLTS